MSSVSLLEKFPLDLLRPIFSLLDPQDWLGLCRVCHAFQADAESLLYRDIHINHWYVQPDIPHRFIRTVLDTPRLSVHIHSLLFQIPPKQTLEQVKDLSRVLQLLTNLRSLELKGYWQTVDSYGLHWKYRDQAWLLKGCSFKLSKFSSGFAITEDFLDFLRRQPDIRDLALHDCDPDIPDIPEEILPNLTSLETYSYALISMGNKPRPISSMRLNMFELGPSKEAKTLDMLQTYAESLRSLCILRTPAYEAMSAANIGSAICNGTPNLRFLSMLDYSSANLSDRQHVHKIVGTKLKSLVTFIWGANYGADDHNYEDVAYGLDAYLRRLDECRGLAEAIPSFKRYICLDWGYCFYYLRLPSGGIQTRQLGPQSWLKDCWSDEGTLISKQFDVV